MAETWRKDEPLTTADLAGTKTRSDAQIPEPVRDGPDSMVDSRPRLVRNEPRNADLDDEIFADSSGEFDGVPEVTTERDFTSERTAAALNRSRETTGISASRELPAAAGSTPLLSDLELTDLSSRWSDIQAGFVDEPRRSVEQADQLVAAAIQRLAEGFARERSSLETQWESGSNVSTEDLRVALQRYRSFFGRLLNAA
jgi:hypothetical protein